MSRGIRMSEAEARRRGYIKDGLSDAQLDATIAYATGFNEGKQRVRQQDAFARILVFLAGFMFGFIVALMFIGREVKWL